jgi:CheY-like chemotaxis protein
MENQRLTILCVDDEPRVLVGLGRNLSHRFEFLSAKSGAIGLQHLSHHSDVAIIISDMHMPEMDGATFLRHARELRPNAIRILLTGQADTHAAIKSINQGQIFRFLTKPWPPTELFGVLDDAQRQYELVVAEKALLHQTLVACIKALVDLLALAKPAAMGRAIRLKRRVSAMGAELKLERRWQLEAAAMLSVLGTIALPQDLIEKIVTAIPLNDQERTDVQEATRAANRVISQIPRFEPLGRLLNCAFGVETEDTLDAVGQQHLELLRLAMELDALGPNADEGFSALTGQHRYSTRMLEAAAHTPPTTGALSQRVMVPVRALRVGMILDEDIYTQRGVLIAPRGLEVSPSTLLHMLRLEPTIRGERVTVLQRKTPTA